MASGHAGPRGTVRPELCVGAVVVAAGSLLLVERARPPGAGLWSFPGGRVEAGETIDASVRREVREETGLDVVPGELVGWVERIAPGHHFVILDFRAALRGAVGAGRELPHPIPGDDARSAQWVELDELGSLQLVDGLSDFLRAHRIWT